MAGPKGTRHGMTLTRFATCALAWSNCCATSISLWPIRGNVTWSSMHVCASLCMYANTHVSTTYTDMYTYVCTYVRMAWVNTLGPVRTKDIRIYIHTYTVHGQERAIACMACIHAYLTHTHLTYMCIHTQNVHGDVTRGQSHVWHAYMHTLHIHI